MPEEPPVPNIDALLGKLAEDVYDPAKVQRLARAIETAIAKGSTTAAGAVSAAKIDSASTVETGIKLVEQLAGGFTSWVLAKAVEQAFDVDISDASVFKLGAAGNRRAVSKLITEKMVFALTGGSKSIEPSAQPAANYLNVVLGQVFESWAIGAAVEIMSGPIPFIDQVQTVGDISNRVVTALGINDSSSRVLRPYIDNLVVEPLRRHIDKQYRPTQLSPADAVRQFVRGRWSREKMVEELATQGYSDERIEAVISATAKNLSFSDAMALLQGGKWTREDTLALLRELGYEEATARLLLAAEDSRRHVAIRDDSLGALRRAHANREISDFEFRKFLVAIEYDAGHRAAIEVAAGTVRDLNVKHLSHGEVREAVKLGILAFRDYRAWLKREGYPDDEALTLELLLRADKDRDTKIEEHRRQADAERAQEKAARDAERAQRKADVEAARALKRRGAPSDLERAVIRGLISFARYTEVLRTEFDDDTVSILVDLVEGDRQTYLAQQAQAERAKQKAARRDLDIGAIGQAVFAGVLTVDQYRQRLAQLSFDQVDIDILADTLAATLADRDDARRQRDEAAARATKRSIDLGRLEQLVRRGVRTLAEYDQTLAALGFDEAARAAMRELLELQIADDRKAETARRDAETRLRAKGLSLEQFRRAVRLQLKTPADYEAFLVQQAIPADVQALLMAELTNDLKEADAARRRRAEAEAQGGSRTAALSTLRRAAQLGVVHPTTYQDRLRALGYGADDVAIEMELLLLEIADVQRRRGTRDTLAAGTPDRGVSLQQLERAVKAGLASLEAYRARLVTLGYGADDVELLVQLLEPEAAAHADARARHEQIAGELAAREIAIGDLDQAVTTGLLSLQAYADRLSAYGYADDDVELLVALLVHELDAKAAKGSGA